MSACPPFTAGCAGLSVCHERAWAFARVGKRTAELASNCPIVEEPSLKTGMGSATEADRVVDVLDLETAASRTMVDVEEGCSFPLLEAECVVIVLVIVVVEVTSNVLAFGLNDDDKEGTMGTRVTEAVIRSAACDDVERDFDTGERLKETPPSPLATTKTDDSDFVVIELEGRMARIVVADAFKAMDCWLPNALDLAEEVELESSIAKMVDFVDVEVVVFVLVLVLVFATNMVELEFDSKAATIVAFV